MKLAKKIPEKLSLKEQINNLGKEVIISDPEFRNQKGIIGSVYIYKGYYIVLDKSYKVKDKEFYSRVKYFKSNDIKLL